MGQVLGWTASWTYIEDFLLPVSWCRGQHTWLFPLLSNLKGFVLPARIKAKGDKQESASKKVEVCLRK